MPTQVVQLTGGAEQIVAGATVNASALGQIVVQPGQDVGNFNIRPLMQILRNTWYWLTQYENTKMQTPQQGYVAGVIAYDRLAPGGVDPGSGKIVQLEVPSKAYATVNVLPFPSIGVGP